MATAAANINLQYELCERINFTHAPKSISLHKKKSNKTHKNLNKQPIMQTKRQKVQRTLHTKNKQQRFEFSSHNTATTRNFHFSLRIAKQARKRGRSERSKRIWGCKDGVRYCCSGVVALMQCKHRNCCPKRSPQPKEEDVCFAETCTYRHVCCMMCVNGDMGF